MELDTVAAVLQQWAVLLAAFAFAATQDAVDPYVLDIHGKERVLIDEGLYRTSSGAHATVDDVASAARGIRFVFVGESHDQASHHALQAAIIEALARAGRDVIVGFEMFTRDNQMNLAPWTTGRWSREEFIENSNWKSQWGFDFAIYEPIFNVVKERRIPMIALNVPREWVRQVGRGGLSVLSPDQKKWVPDPDLGNAAHRALFSALMGGHPLTGTQGENVYSAQVTWDEGMATSALEYMSGRFSRNAVMVVVAGSGHMMYGQGINYRILRKTGEASLNVACLTSAAPREVSRGIAEFVFVSRPVPTP